MVDVVETNLYVFNSKYDAWQLQNELQTKFSNGTTPAEQAAVRAYGNDFMHDFEPAGTNKNGGFITKRRGRESRGRRSQRRRTRMYGLANSRDSAPAKVARPRS